MSQYLERGERQFIHFFNCQIEEIDYGGLPVMHRKDRKALL